MQPRRTFLNDGVTVLGHQAEGCLCLPTVSVCRKWNKGCNYQCLVFLFKSRCTLLETAVMECGFILHFLAYRGRLDLYPSKTPWNLIRTSINSVLKQNIVMLTSFFRTSFTSGKREENKLNATKHNTTTFQPFKMPQFWSHEKSDLSFLWNAFSVSKGMGMAVGILSHRASWVFFSRNSWSHKQSKSGRSRDHTRWRQSVNPMKESLLSSLTIPLILSWAFLAEGNTH